MSCMYTSLETPVCLTGGPGSIQEAELVQGLEEETCICVNEQLPMQKERTICSQFLCLKPSTYS